MNDLIVKIEKATRKVELEQIYIGNDYENLQEKLVFEFDEFVDGQGRLEYEINNTKNYIILTKEEETYTIPVQNVLTIYQANTMGKIKFQLVVTEGTEEENIPVFKSNIFYLKCRPSINAVNEAPEGYELWIEQANSKLNAMDEALEEVDNLDLDISQEAGITTLTITKKDGTQESESIEIPTKLSDLTNDNNTVTDASYVHTDNNYTTSEKTKLAGLNNYDDTEVRGLIAGKVDKETGKGLSTNDYTTAEKTKLANLENYNDAEIKQDIVDLGINKADKNEIPDVSSFITKSVNDLVYYYKKTETYTQAEVNSLIGAISTINIEVVQTLPTQDISTSTIYLVPKTASTNDNYDEYIYVSNSWEHIGSTDVDLSGYQTKIDSTHKLSADLVDDTSTTNKFTNATEKNAWNAKYDKPSGGIPDTDLSSAVQNSLGKADSAIQDISGKQDKIDSSHKLSADLITDGSTNKTVTATEKSTWSEKQEALVSGTNIKTINNESILGSGNITIQGGGGSSTDVRINGTSIVSDDIANIVTNSSYNPSTSPLATMNDLNAKQDKLLESVWRFVIPGVVYEHAEGLVEDAIVNLYSDAASEYNAETLIDIISSQEQETLYLNTLDYPLTKMVIDDEGDKTYVAVYNLDFSEGESELGIKRVDTTKPCFGLILGNEPEAPSGHVLIAVSTEEIREVTWAFVKESDIKYIAPVAISGDYKDIVNKPTIVNETSTTAGDVYDVRYINSAIGDIETLLSGI